MVATVSPEGTASEPGQYPAAWFCVAAALLLAVGSSSTNPTPSTLLAIVALVLSGAAALGAAGRLVGDLRERSVITILAVGIFLEVFVGFLAPAVLDSRYLLAFGVAGGVAIYGVFASGLRQRAALVIVVAIHFGLMMWMFGAVPLRDMDVHLVQQEAAAALLNGVNPYSITFENIYGYGTPLYPMEVQQGDRLLFGFPYPPLSLLMTVPGFALMGDYRVAALLAISITALLIGFMRTGPLAVGAAAMLLLSPLTARVLHNGWTEPFVVLWLALTVFLAVRRLAATAVAIGLLIAAKQYTPILWPLAIGLLADVRRRLGTSAMVAISLGTAVATVLPFLIWGPERFLFSTIGLQLLQPFREDGATIAALLARSSLWVPPVWLGLAAVAAILVVVLRRSPKTPSGFSIAAAVVLTALFLLSRTAFMNYYFVAMTALLSAVAATEPSRSS